MTENREKYSYCIFEDNIEVGKEKLLRYFISNQTKSSYPVGLFLKSYKFNIFVGIREKKQAWIQYLKGCKIVNATYKILYSLKSKECEICSLFLSSRND